MTVTNRRFSELRGVRSIRANEVLALNGQLDPVSVPIGSIADPAGTAYSLVTSLSNSIDLQFADVVTSLDGKAPIVHTHTQYANKSGDTFTGLLTLNNGLDVVPNDTGSTIRFWNSTNNSAWETFANNSSAGAVGWRKSNATSMRFFAEDVAVGMFAGNYGVRVRSGVGVGISTIGSGFTPTAVLDVDGTFLARGNATFGGNNSFSTNGGFIGGVGTDSAVSNIYLRCRNYTAANAVFQALFAQSDNNHNRIHIGGGTAGINAASNIQVFCGATTNSNTGTLIWNLYSGYSEVVNRLECKNVFVPHKLTNSQINLLSGSQAQAGCIIYSTDENMLCFHNGTSWQKLTSMAL